MFTNLLSELATLLQKVSETVQKKLLGKLKKIPPIKILLAVTEVS